MGLNKPSKGYIFFLLFGKSNLITVVILDITLHIVRMVLLGTNALLVDISYIGTLRLGGGPLAGGMVISGFRDDSIFQFCNYFNIESPVFGWSRVTIPDLLV
ncbi:hypothetical protein ACH5RR_011221 [Cinchona calisaya]|uniref:Uncharacterized protein n=1 Tax=Cinchona calisaya TaxID=153742 RepID=A0ABD3A498_9GENT